MFKQATNWSKTLRATSLLWSCIRTLCRHTTKHSIVRVCFKAFRSFMAYKYFAGRLVRNAHAGHIPANDHVAIKAHCLSSLKASTTYFTFLAMKRNGTVVAVQCSCVTGQ